MVVALSAGGMVLPPPRGGEQLVALTDSTVIAATADVQRAMLELPATAEAIVAALLEALLERQESLAQFANVAHAERLREKLSSSGVSTGGWLPAASGSSCPSPTSCSARSSARRGRRSPLR